MSGLILGLTGLAVGVATTAASFGQAAAQGKKQKKAQSAADKALQDARKRLDVNYMEDLGINKEIYDIARDRSMVQAAGLMETAREGSTRGVASTAGQVYQQDLLGQQQIMAQQEQEMNRIEGLIAAEDARLEGLQADLSLQEAEGAQKAAAEAENAKRAAISQGIEGAISTVGQAASMAPLYGKGTAGKRQQAMAAASPGGGIEGMTRREYLQYEKTMPKALLAERRGSDAYVNTLQSLRPGQGIQNSPFIFNMGASTGGLNNLSSEEIQRLILLQKYQDLLGQ
jgi:hypothetical protein